MKQTFHAKESQTFWLILMMFAIVNLLFLEHRIAVFPYVFLVVVVIALFLSYELVVEEKKLTLFMKVFGKTVITRELEPTNIKEMYFISFGNSSTVLIKLKKGLRWRITKFKPDSFMDELESFANRHSINTQDINRKKEKTTKGQS
ncbi:hypothetical protein [Alkalihalobacterium bogoriense]|uniref:hypothetical protein n=1 Tax=Alkalihalobacterium bogoriense TaxID=246272 RepID=UPI00047CF4D5|nr:hypothetical protein [Alkalihalobacterium bogoriense]